MHRARKFGKQFLKVKRGDKVFPRLIEKMSNKKIGITTWHYYWNYGSQLQTYASYHTLQKLGYKPLVLNYHNPKLGVPNNLKTRIKEFLAKLPLWIVALFLKKYTFPTLRFSSKLSHTSVVYNGQELTPYTKNLDAVVCGSDQIWAPNCYNPVYMLDFVPDNIKKISYAASIGLNEIPQDLVPEYKKYIGRLDYVSVREEKGKELLKNQCGIDSTVVLDPTFLVDIDDWRKIEVTSNIKEPYIFCYFLKADNQYKEPVMKFAEKNHLTVYGVSDNPKDREWMNILTHQTVGPREFIGLINDANFVITDSYHGTIFSLLHHKDFITIERFASDDKICQNSRIYQLIKNFGIAENIIKIENNTELQISPVDYNKFEQKLKELRAKSLAFLSKALS